jgi:hypothetical protein
MFIANNSLSDRVEQRPRARSWLGVAFALGVVVLTFVVARAQQQANDDPTFRK